MHDSTKVYVAVIDGDESLCRSLSQPRRASGIQPVTQLSAEGFLADSKRPDAEWLNILSSPSEPSNAWLKIKHRGSWFYIAADDVNSRASFTLLDAIFTSVVGSIPGAKPLLTLPVK